VGRIVVTEFVSLDGVIEDPGGAEGFEHGGWTFRFDRGQDGDQFKLDELEDAEAQLLGRATYETFAAAWPSRDDAVGFAKHMNTMPKYVVSATMRDEDATWNNSTVIRGDVVSEIAALKNTVQGTLLVAGSATLVHTLLEHRLVDELRLMVFPIVLGTGKRLFGEVSEPPTLVLDSVATVGEGILTLVYRAAP
jgi:dihydrofolate reductase